MALFSSSKALTEEEQQRAVAELRSLLEQLKNSEASVEDLLRKGGEPGLITERGLDDQTLKRWLRAEGFNVRKAEARLRSHAPWRASYVPSGRILEVGANKPNAKVFSQFAPSQLAAWCTDLDHSLI